MRRSLLSSTLDVHRISWVVTRLLRVTTGPRLWLMAISWILYCTPSTAQPVVRLQPGMVITSDVRVEPGEYVIPADSSGAIVIRGNDIVVDMSGAVLSGAPDAAGPDKFHGTGILIDGARNVTLRAATVRGYKVGLHAVDADGLQILSGDFSYNYRQRLKSTIEREHLDDWMSYHDNESDEWLRYGAAIYVRSSDGILVRDVVVSGGQNGILLTEVKESSIVDNDITFNSGIGVGLYRSSNNRIQSNRLDWNVRGYSHGIYNRGQDSAAILLYEQSNENTIAYNSATHSGDGLFLWAGQTTMDTGLGGCNDNLILGNDFSYAPTNGIEVTFSRNRIVGNHIEGCWHGIWGGYSFDTVIDGNVFADNEEHVAIEHGQRIRIRNNVFSGGDLGIRSWERTSQPQDWGYAQSRDVRSQRFLVEHNRFVEIPFVLSITDADTVMVTDNLFGVGTDSISVAGSNRVHFAGNTITTSLHVNGSSVDSLGAFRVNPVLDLRSDISSRGEGATPAGRGDDVDFHPALPPNPLADRSYILVDEWGPLDFRSPALWPRSDRRALTQEFEVVGPTGDWRIISIAGGQATDQTSGKMFDRFGVRLADSPIVDLRIELEYVGEHVTDRFGRQTAAGQPVRFSYSYSFVPLTWDVSFFKYDDASDPRSSFAGFRRLLAAEPLANLTTEDLSIQAYRNPAPNVPADKFATVATTTVSVPAGAYVFEVTSDDGVRVWVDGREVFEDWTYHAPRTAEVELELGGEHEIRIEHFEIDGYATLAAQLRRR